MSEVKRYQVIGYLVEVKTLGRINAVSLSDYAALAAQRDEGLAREAQRKLVIDGLSLENQDLQQRLAEAEKLARSLLDEYDEAKQNARQYRPGAVIGLALRFLASPGCADGEKEE